MKNNNALLFLGIGLGLLLLVQHGPDKRAAILQVDPGTEWRKVVLSMTDSEINWVYRAVVLKEAIPAGSEYRRQINAIGLKYNIFT